MKMAQQGDVVLIRVNIIPPNASPKKDRHLAEGEATGHYHEANGNGVSVLESGGDLYVESNNDFEVNHQEHKTIVLPAGKYKVNHVKEYDHFAEEARRVVD
jgi:hypothetical protein